MYTNMENRWFFSRRGSSHGNKRQQIATHCGPYQSSRVTQRMSCMAFCFSWRGVSGREQDADADSDADGSNDNGRERGRWLMLLVGSKHEDFTYTPE